MINSVAFCSPINSTTFTTCCGCAIGEEECCPKCGEKIEGYSENKQKTINERFRIAFSKQKKGIFKY